MPRAKAVIVRERAHHEAGHVVVALRQGIDVHLVTLCPKLMSGPLKLKSGGAAAVTDCAILHVSRKQDALAAIRKDIVVCLAGAHAQMRYRGERPRILDGNIRPEWQTDLVFAVSLTSLASWVRGGRSLSWRRKLLHECDASAARLVLRNWPAISRVAASLQRRKTLDATDIAKLLTR